MTLTVQCPSCCHEHEVTFGYTRPELSVGYGGGYEVEDGPDVCGSTGRACECGPYWTGPCGKSGAYFVCLGISIPLGACCPACLWDRVAISATPTLYVVPLAACPYRFTRDDRRQWEPMAEEEDADRAGEAMIAAHEERRR